MFHLRFCATLLVPLLCLLLLLGYSVQGHPPAAATTPPAAAAAASYDSKFDNVDLDEILSQERLLNNYIKCLESLGPCTPDAKMLKDILPDAMTTECVKCTEKQKFGADKVTRHLIDNRPEDWKRLEKIYDPEGTYRIKYEESKTIMAKADDAPEPIDQAQGDD